MELCLYTRLGSVTQQLSPSYGYAHTARAVINCCMDPAAGTHVAPIMVSRNTSCLRLSTSITRLLQLIDYRNNVCERHRRGNDPDGARAPYFTGAIRCW